jgi:hypothetical protein
MITISLFIDLVCSLPPEYCRFDKKDFSECKNWLKTTDLELFFKVYPEEAEVKEGEEKKEGEEAK